MYDDYERFWKQYRPLYGPNTAIFLQVGSFYELYDRQDPESGQCDFNVRDLVDFLGIQLTIRRGDAGAGKDGLFAGIPDYTLHKWAGKLTDNGWTVVVVDQVKDAGGRVARRQVSRILSPGTHWENAAAAEAPIITGIWLSTAATAAPAAAAPQFGVASFDLSTGVTNTFRGDARGRADVWSSDDLVHYLQVHAPRELIVWWTGDALFLPDEATLRRRLAYQGGALHIRQAAPDSLDKPLVREQFLREVYNIQSLLPTLQWLGLGGEDATATAAVQALAHLLLFVKEHLPSAFERLHKNRQWAPAAALRLGNNAATQLQIIAPRIQDSLLGLFQGCLTPMGKRGIRPRLMTPTADHEILEQRYTQIAAIHVAPEQARHNLGKLLRSIYDLPRLHRRMVCAQTAAPDIGCLHQSYVAAELLAATAPPALAPPQPLIAALTAWRTEVFQEEFSVSKAATASEDQTYLQAGPGQNEDIHELEERLARVRADIQQFLQSCRNLAGNDGLRLEPREKQPYSVRGTPTALKALRAALGPDGPATIVPALKGAEVSIQKSGGHVEAPWLDAANSQVQRLREQLAAALKARLPVVCRRVVDAAEETGLWRQLEEWVENVDITNCFARVAAERGYCRPTLLAAAPAAAGSAFQATGLRHPLIESIVTRTEYVKHDVALGGDADATGWLVYGMNASGKSSLMKAIGLAIHMAQCGCYVPATTFNLRPFRAIYTRILNHDNLWAGLSSFAVEMSEMRDILTAADRHTLVLGDELCAGTETTSAHALVAAGIKWLARQEARYVFATHLHGLLESLPAPAELRLAVWHLRVIYDAVHDRLIYERSLRPGPGRTIYGLEVARAMHLPLAFLEDAHAIRRRLLGTATEAEAEGSAWNSAVARRVCEVCGAAVVRDLEVHHIRPRVEAGDSKHFEDGSARDDARNLVVVCQRCHDEHHAGRLDIQPLRQTSEGPMRVPAAAPLCSAPAPAPASAPLDFSQFSYKGTLSVESSQTTAAAATPAHPKCKWSVDDQAAILKVLREFPTLSLKLLVFKLQHEYEIEISEATLRKVRKDGGFN